MITTKKILVNTLLIVSYSLLTLLAMSLLYEYYLISNDKIDVSKYVEERGRWAKKEVFLDEQFFPTVYFVVLSIISWITYVTRRMRGNLKYFYVILALVLLYFFFY